MHSTSGRMLKNSEPVYGLTPHGPTRPADRLSELPGNAGQRPARGPAAAQGSRPTILLDVSQFMAGRQLAEYAFHSGFLPSLLAALPLGGLFHAAPKFPPGIETGQHSVRPASVRGAGRSNGTLAAPPVPLNGSSSGCQSRTRNRAGCPPRRPIGRAVGSAGPVHKHNIVLSRTEGEAR